MNERVRRIGELDVLISAVSVEIAILRDRLEQISESDVHVADEYLDRLEHRIDHYTEVKSSLMNELSAIKAEQLQNFAAKTKAKTLVQDR